MGSRTLPRGGREAAGSTDEGPCGREAFPRYPQLFKGLEGDDVEAGAPVDEGFGDRDAADCGRADERYGPHEVGRLGVVADVEVEPMLETPRRLGGPDARVGSVDFPKTLEVVS